MKQTRVSMLFGSLLLGSALLGACTVTVAPEPIPTPPAKHSLWGTVRLPGGAAGASSAAVIPGQYLVRLAPGVSAQAHTLSAAGVTLERQRGGFAGLGVYHAQRGALSAQTWSPQREQAVLEALEARPEVLSVLPNVRLHAYTTPSDPLHPLQWDQRLIRLPEAWTLSTGRAVTVAVVDTGITAHPDLQGALLPGYDFVSDPESAADGDAWDDDPTDEGGDSGYHGSHVAGIIAARANNGLGIAGVSWGARVLPVRVLGEGGGSLIDILSGAWWAAGGEVEGVPINPNPAQILNLSLGGENPCAPEVQQIFDALAERGVTVVVAAGNENMDARRSFPANCTGIITVGAVGPDGARAPYSNFGPRVDVMAAGGNLKLKFEVGGKSYPGGVYSTIVGEGGRYAYAPYQGTSMAAPQVAGLAALLKGLEPSLTPAQLRERLRATARPLPAAACGLPQGCGTGLIDALAALKNLNTPPTPVPTPPTQTLKTLVFALHLRGGDPENVDIDLSQFEEVQSQGSRSLFRVRDLTAGFYAVVAWQDLDGDLEIDAGEPIGAHRQIVDLRTQDRGDLNLMLEPFEAQSLAERGDVRSAMQRVLEHRRQR